MPRSIHSYRLDSGDLTLSSVSDGTAVRMPVLPSAVTASPIGDPAGERYSVETEVVGRLLIATIGSRQRPLLHAWVVLDGRDLARIVPGPRVLDLPTPVCIVEVLEPSLDPVEGWIRSLLDTLALAWVSHSQATSANG